MSYPFSRPFIRRCTRLPGPTAGPGPIYRPRTRTGIHIYCCYTTECILTVYILYVMSVLCMSCIIITHIRTYNAYTKRHFLPTPIPHNSDPLSLSLMIDDRVPKRRYRPSAPTA